MSTKLYNEFENNSILNIFGNRQQFTQALSNFTQQFMKNSSYSPEQTARQLLNSGRMSQGQFDKFRQIANWMTGRNF